MPTNLNVSRNNLLNLVPEHCIRLFKIETVIIELEAIIVILLHCTETQPVPPIYRVLRKCAGFLFCSIKHYTDG